MAKMITIESDLLEVRHGSDSVNISVALINFPDGSFGSRRQKLQFQTGNLNIDDYVSFLKSEQAKILGKTDLPNPLKKIIRTARRGNFVTVYVMDVLNNNTYKITYTKPRYIVQVLKREMIKTGLLTENKI